MLPVTVLLLSINEAQSTIFGRVYVEIGCVDVVDVVRSPYLLRKLEQGTK